MDDPEFPLHRLAHLFSQIRRLKLTLTKSESLMFIQSALELLHSSVKLQNLKFISMYSRPVLSPGDYVVLPELNTLWTNTPYLMDRIRAPKLAGFVFKGKSLGHNSLQIFEEYDLSTIRYLYLRRSFCYSRRCRPVRCLS